MTKYLFLLLLLVGCVAPENKSGTPKEKSVKDSNFLADSIRAVNSEKESERSINDTLNKIAQLISGTADSTGLFGSITKNNSYIDFSESFSKRWKDFDSSRITKLVEFRNKELVGEIKSETIIFYPFSGPDILYPTLFFPNAQKYILIGLEPVGTLPEFNISQKDSLKRYYNKLNTSLNAILKFSFFRTESMSRDLKNTEVNGTLHLLFLFLNRTGNSIISAKPISIDSLGSKIYLPSFGELRWSKLKTKGTEITFKTADGKVKELDYFSLNASNDGLRNNAGFVSYLGKMKDFNTYLKGASYLLHKPHFSIIRNVILKGSNTIVQDDSGIAFNYFKNSGTEWNYKLFGSYTKPISMFRNRYQSDLDSLYKQKGSTALGFGIGYNFKDKNSNLMIATRK